MVETSVWRQKPSDFFIMIFGARNTEEIWQQKIISLPPHLYTAAALPWKVQKKSFSTMLFICVSECLGYYWIKWITTVTMQLSGRSLPIESVWSDPSLHGHTQCVTPLFDRWNSVHVSTSRCRNSTTIHIPGYTLMHHAQDAIIHNLGQDCRMATCYGLKN